MTRNVTWQVVDSWEQAGDARPPSSYAHRASTAVSPGAPGWFHEALAAPCEVGEVEVAGTPIRYLSWGPTTGPATVLVHGGAAHAQWWAPLAPHLAPDTRVVAIDMSGHGLSGRSEVYSVHMWADEILGVARETSKGPATIIGHSLGGIVSTYAAERHGHNFARVVAIDAPVWSHAPVPDGAPRATANQPVRTYTTAEEAHGRFRLIPPQPCANDWYIDHIAWHGLHRTAAGWQWRFDPRIFANPTGEHRIARFEGSLADIWCPYAVVMGARSYLAPEAREVFSAHGSGIPVRFVDDAAHHVMLDQPRGLLAELQDLLATWP